MRNIGNLGVVFVDDDFLVLDAIKREFRKINPNWSLFFASSAMSAIDLINDKIKELDVLVCDMKMPILSGVDVLRITRKVYPQILRVTLSGQLDVTTLLGSDKFSDMHICKPITSERLSQKIVEAYGARWPNRKAT